MTVAMATGVKLALKYRKSFPPHLESECSFWFVCRNYLVLMNTEIKYTIFNCARCLICVMFPESMSTMVL